LSCVAHVLCCAVLSLDWRLLRLHDLQEEAECARFLCNSGQSVLVKQGGVYPLIRCFLQQIVLHERDDQQSSTRAAWKCDPCLQLHSSSLFLQSLWTLNLARNLLLLLHHLLRLFLHQQRLLLPAMLKSRKHVSFITSYWELFVYFVSLTVKLHVYRLVNLYSNLHLIEIVSESEFAESSVSMNSVQCIL